MSRPSIYTDEIVKQICERLGEGEPLAQICRGEGFPSYTTVWNWMQEKPDVSEAIARAREHGEDVIASNLRNIARKGEGSSDDVQRDKLIIETDLKLLAKWNPKKYGDKLDFTTDGKSLNDAKAVDTRLAYLLGKAGIAVVAGGEGPAGESE